MSKPSRRPLHKDIFPAAASFAVTLTVGLAISFFQLTGGFPDARQDRPAFVADEATDIGGAEPTLVAEAEAPPPDPPLAPEPASAEPDARPVSYETDLAAPPPTVIDTESIDSILAGPPRFVAQIPAGRNRLPFRESAGTGDAVQFAPRTTAAPPPQIAIDIAAPPQTGGVD
jgi:hypothetical protein